MDYGIIALVGVLIGSLIARPPALILKKKEKEKAVPELTEEEKKAEEEVKKQWQNLLSYDGRAQK